MEIAELDWGVDFRWQMITKVSSQAVGWSGNRLRELETAAAAAAAGTSIVICRRADINPEQGDNNWKEPSPDVNNGRRPASPAHQTLGEWV